ncbi:hypothetical protein AKJ59_00210 [candidate division MSBL1 archaeon SCGC-AAA385M02]|uniref:Uncharacterized protein n=1 Tax=candidate division MSBL1 archaeon SCGC-AAA385M02 TaxID=1698287 RepID=A0A133VR85_9EURY|nr:hypothetical protein AKJ59_00210 [candidate division MSBL1 archaeon SCGC-AAA385M02]
MHVDRYYHIYKRIDENVFSHFALIKVLNENDDTLIESWCKQKLGNRYAVRNGKLLEVWKYKMCYKTYEEVSQAIQRK